MSDHLAIDLAPERLEDGSPEERASFGMLTIRANGIALTEGFDHFVQALRPGPLVSGFHAAEWFAWNWWRLMYEPYRPRSGSWGLAHRLPAIGAGYVWPNVEIRSDGRRATLFARPSSQPDAKPFRYLGGPIWLGPRTALEGAVDTFISAVLGRLHEFELVDTNLDAIWAELLGERQDPATSRRRRLEALIGLEAGDADDAIIDGMIADSDAIGQDAVEELAADAQHGHPLRSSDLADIAEMTGITAKRADGVALPPQTARNIRRDEVAGRQGKLAAEWLRHQLASGDQAIATSRLLEMIGASGTTAEHPASDSAMQGADTRPPLSFVMAGKDGSARIVLRSRWPTGQRFDLARLLGDHLLFGQGQAVLPATRAYTFRQKAQRSFAAELLSPLAPVSGMLAGDFSDDAIEDVARHFDVSPWTIRTLLMNHGLLDREPSADAA